MKLLLIILVLSLPTLAYAGLPITQPRQPLKTDLLLAESNARLFAETNYPLLSEATGSDRSLITTPRTPRS